jgi:anti-anti-sigma factor
VLSPATTVDPAVDLRMRVERERETAQALKDYLRDHGQAVAADDHDGAFAWSVAHGDDDRAVLTFSGELDVYVAHRFRDALVDLAEAGTVHLDLDLGAVTFLDSHGLSVLLHAHTRALRQGGSVHVIALSPQVERVLETTGTRDQLKVRLHAGD